MYHALIAYSAHMDYRFWLEVQTGPSLYHQMAQRWQLPHSKHAREFLTIPADAALEELPECMALQHLLDAYEQKRSDLDEAGLPTGRTAIWARMNTEGPMRLDSMILGQLGTEYLNLCLTDELSPLASRKGPVQYLPAEVMGLWIEAEVDGQAAYTVSLSDGSSWEGNLVRFDQIQTDIHHAEGPIPSLIYPNATFVPWIHEKAALRVVEELLRTKRLEQVLHPTEAEFGQPEPSHTHFEIQVMHEADTVLSRVGPILGAQEMSIRQSNQSIRISCPSYHQAGIASLEGIVNLLEKEGQALHQAGIRRQDISITWHKVYSNQLRAELPADLMYRLSRLGLSLELDWRPAASRRVRYLA